MNDTSLSSLIYYSLLFLFISSTLIYYFKQHLRKSLIYVIIWAALFLALIGLYSFRTEISMISSRIMATLIPGTASQTNDGALHYYPTTNGHFYIKLQVNNQPITFLVDTGASDIVLNHHDAESIGIDVNALSYNKRYLTANGTTKAASITLRDINLGSTNFKNVPAAINRSDMSHSLLGMTFLKRITRYEFSNHRLSIWP